MKRTFSLLLALVMGCSMLAACGITDKLSDKSSRDKSSSSSDELVTEERKFEKLIDEKEKNGTCTVSVAVETGGRTIDGYITTDGESTYTLVTADGITVGALITPEADYLINIENNKYYKSESGATGISVDEATLTGNVITMDGLTYVKTTTETIEGSEYVVEHYMHQDGSLRQFAFDGDDNIAFLGNGLEYMALFYSAKADTSKLSIEGYTEMTDKEFVDWYNTSFRDK